MTTHGQRARGGNGSWGRYTGRYTGLVVLAVLLVGLGLTPQPARAAQAYMVTTLADTVADANCVVASCTLRQAIKASNANDPGAGNTNTIAFAAGVTGTVTLRFGIRGFGPLVLSRSVTLTGPGVSLLTISGGNAVQPLIVDSGVTAMLTDLTIANGAAVSGNGGGIANSGALTVTNCAITGNVTTDTTADGGGGIWNGGTLRVNDSTISNNTSGGRIGGGAIVNRNGGIIAIANSTLSGNVANYGGGIVLYDGTMTVTNSTLSGNSVGAFGGGIFVYGGTATVTNSTLSGNATSGGSGGGIRNTGTLSLTNSLVVNSIGGDLTGDAPAMNSHNITGAFTFADGSTTVPGNHGGPTATFALLPGSPAIDAGVCNPTYPDLFAARVATVTTDQRGVSRPQGAGCDVGSTELRTLSLALTAGDGQSAPVTTAFAPLQVTVTSTPMIAASGVPVTFTAPAGGASGTFAGGATSVTVTTDRNGTAPAPAFTANTVAGSYTVSTRTAVEGGNPIIARFDLTNTAGAATSISVVSGSNQSAQIGSAFGASLTVFVKDAHGNPVPGATVAFAVPTGNVSEATFSNATATTDASGYASITATAAGRPGVFTVTATVNGVNTSFTLTDTAAPFTLTLTGFAPPTGPTAGGTSVTITGTNLAGVTAVTIDGVNAPITAHTNTPTAVTVTTPPHAAGTVDITVTAGRQTATIHGYTYVDTGNIAVQPVLHPLPGGGNGGGGSPAPAPARHADAGGDPQPHAASAPVSVPMATPNAQPGRH